MLIGSLRKKIQFFFTTVVPYKSVHAAGLQIKKDAEVQWSVSEWPFPEETNPSVVPAERTGMNADQTAGTVNPLATAN